MTTATQKVEKGMQFRSVIADCNALWEVKRKQGRGAWLCEVVNEPFEYNGQTFDSDHAGRQKAFLEREILGSIGIANLFTELGKRDEDYLAKLPVGAIVHKVEWPKSFVRFQVVMHNGKKGYKAIAIVGEWRKHDLPHWAPYGEPAYIPLEIKRVMDGEVVERLQYSTIYEHPNCEKKPGTIDPRKLSPIDLTLPPMTAEQKEAARLWKLIEATKQTLDTFDAKGDAYHPDMPKKFLRAAYELLKKEFGG